MARQISRDAAQAFKEGRTFSRDNTTVAVGHCPKTNMVMADMYLFGNKIAQRKGSTVEICDGGHKSATTKERLNALGFHYGARVSQQDWTWYLTTRMRDREMMDHRTWYIIQEGTAMELLAEGLTT